jgi:hypothetical protein
MIHPVSDPELLPSVYWFWHSIPGTEEIERQVRDMHKSGIRTFLIQARLAFPLSQYLSEEYFTAYEKAVQLARDLGMDVGIYDEYNWDSGHAGGRAIQLDDNAREVHLFWSVGKLENGHCECSISGIHSLMYTEMGDPVMQWIYEGGKPIWNDWKLFTALAVREGQMPSTEETREVTDACVIERTGDTSCRVVIDLRGHPELEGCRIAVFAHARCTTSRLINYLSSGAVESFIKAGYEPYRQHLSKYFGGPIRYMFFDHPYNGFYDWDERTGNLGNSLMFDPDLPLKFQASKGYPIEQALLSFILDQGARTPTLRCDFFEVYGEVGRSNFFGKLSAWTKKNGLGLSGHELLAHVGAWV